MSFRVAQKKAELRADRLQIVYDESGKLVHRAQLFGGRQLAIRVVKREKARRFAAR